MALLLGIRKKSVQSSRQSQILTWNVCQRAPTSNCLTSYDVDSFEQKGVMCSLIDSVQDKPQWVYLATVDQVNPNNLSSLTRAVAEVKGQHTKVIPVNGVGQHSHLDYDNELKLRAVAIAKDYSVGLYPTPARAKLVSDVIGLFSTSLTSAVCVFFEVFYLVI
mgnify:FL=1